MSRFYVEPLKSRASHSREGITEEIVESSGKTGIIVNSQLSSLAAVIRLDSKRASVWDAKRTNNIIS